VAKNCKEEERYIIYCAVTMHKCKQVIQVNNRHFFLSFFVIAPCISIFIQFIHQQMHIY